MAHINLVDWRTELAEERRQELYAWLGLGVVISAVIAAAIYFSVDFNLKNHISRNDYLKAQIEVVDKKIIEVNELGKVKQGLLDRMHVVEKLQESRSASVHFMDDLINSLPSGVYLSSIKQQGNSVEIQGVAQSNARVSEYLRNLDDSDWMASPNLIVIKTTELNRESQAHFTISAQSLSKAKSVDKAEKEEADAKRQDRSDAAVAAQAAKVSADVAGSVAKATQQADQTNSSVSTTPTVVGSPAPAQSAAQPVAPISGAEPVSDVNHTNAEKKVVSNPTITPAPAASNPVSSSSTTFSAPASNPTAGAINAVPKNATPANNAATPQDLKAKPQVPPADPKAASTQPAK